MMFLDPAGYARADRTFGFLDRDRDFQDRLKRAADIKVLSLAVDKHRYRLERARKLARGHHRRSTSKKIALCPPSAAPSSPASAANRITATESPFGQTINDFCNKICHKPTFAA